MGTDLFGNEVEVEEEVVIEKSDKPTPFDFMASVSETKKDIIKDNPDMIKHYNAYITNRGFGYFPDSVLYANEMNMYPDIPGEAQYYYYHASLRKRKRRSKWFKLEKNEDVEMIRRIYHVRSDVAKQYLQVLSDNQLETLRALTDTGEVAGKKGKKK